jgi:thiol-disulfide isomerase/thioredoxin
MDFNDVAYLEDTDFDGNKLKLKGPTMVMVWASWCGHCKKAHPDYQAFADEMKKNKNITVACIQADGARQSEQNLAKKIKTIIPEFRGFPGFYFFQDGKLVDTLEGPRTKDNFMSFSKKNL